MLYGPEVAAGVVWRRAGGAFGPAGAIELNFPPASADVICMTDLRTEAREVQLTEQEIWFGYKGRISRGQYWGRFALMWLGSFAVGLALGSVSEEAAGLVILAVMGVGLWIGTALAWKRVQDQGRGGAMFLLVLIPIAGPIIWITLSLLAGSPAENQYGPRTGYRYP